MNIPQQIGNIVDMLTEKTKSKKINWKTTSRSSEFQFTFSSGEFVTVDRWKEEHSELTSVDICIYNKMGVAIQRIIADETDSEYKTLIELYNNILNTYLRIDETFSNIYSELIII